MCFFFFQAEDGIRDLTVTGVQTCALPISRWSARDTTQHRACSSQRRPGSPKLRRPPSHPEPRSSAPTCGRSEEHTSELQSQSNLVCRLLLEKKKATVRQKRVAR